jgi:hypothetical protein
MSIPLDKYFVVTPASQQVSKAYATLNGTDLFFYVTETSNLSVVNMNSTGSNASPGSVVYTLATSITWVGVVSRPGVCHVYFADVAGLVWYIPYMALGGTPPAPVQITNVVPVPDAPISTFSVIYTPQTTPPAYMMMTFDGVYHRIYVASDPLFQSLLAPTQITYNNALAPTFFVTEPNISMHPLDTINLTVFVQQLNENNSVVQVGFYGAAAPGVS